MNAHLIKKEVQNDSNVHISRLQFLPQSERVYEEEIRYLLERSENGSDDLISNRSKIIKEGNRDIETMKLSDLVSFIRKNPSILKRPIIIDNSSLEIGYDEEEISIFKKNNEKRLSLAL